MATSPGTHSPKTRTSTEAPGTASANGRYANAIDAPNSVPQRARGHPPDRSTGDSDRFVAQHLAERVGEGETGQSAVGLTARGQGIPPQELLVQLHAEAEPGLVRRLVGGDVRAPVPVALLHAAASRSPCSRRPQPVRLPRLDELTPQGGSVLRGAVELPAQLADERHPEHADRHGRPRWSRARSGTGRPAGQGLRVSGWRISRAVGPHSAEAGPLAGDVHGRRRRPSRGGGRPDPGQVVAAERRAGHDLERLGVERVTVKSHSMPPRALSIWV